MPRLLLGPLLRYAGGTQATVWVETDAPCEVAVLDARALRVTPAQRERITSAIDRAKLDASRGVDLVVYPPRRSLYDLLSNPFGSSSTTSGLGVLFQRPEAQAIESAALTLRRFRRGEPLALMPNVFVK